MIAVDSSIRLLKPRSQRVLTSLNIEDEEDDQYEQYYENSLFILFLLLQ